MIDLLEALVGAIILTIGALAVASFFLGRRENARDRSAWWFGVFVLLYGLRLMSVSALVRAAFGFSDVVWSEVAAAMTYIIPLPAALFVEAILGMGWHRLLRRLWQALLVYALAALTIDVIARRPGAGMFLNPPFVLAGLAVTLAHLAALWRRQGVS